jgi:diguanylate cyclase (GGDEF)-like protein
MLFIDLDGFKAVNDSYGHEAGDRYLSAFAAILEEIFRDSDTLARWGGDEFVVLLPEADREATTGAAQRLIAKLQGADFDLGAGRCRPCASVGIAVFPEDAQEPDALIARADRAMYEAKRQGGHALRSCPGPAPA